MKKIIYFFLILFCFNGFAQKSDLTSAILAYKKNDFQMAKEAIDNAAQKIESGSVLKPKIMAKYYHYRGHIYLKMFKLSDSTQTSRFDLLDVATNSLLLDATSAESSFSKKSILALNECASLYIISGYTNYENKEFDVACGNFIKAVDIKSSSAIAQTDTATMSNICLSALYAENYSLCADWASKLIKLDPYNEGYHTYLINSYKEEGELSMQLEAIKNARKNIPYSKDIILQEVDYYLSSGENELLLKSLDTAVASDPNNPVLHFVLGLTYTGLDNIQKAKQAYQQAIELDPNYVDAYNNLSGLLLEERNILIVKKNDLDYSQQKLFNKYNKQIDDYTREVLPYLESGLKLDPTSSAFVNALKEIYYNLGQVESMKKMQELEKLPNEDKRSFVDDFFSK